MPSDNKVRHPINQSIDITFKEEDHSYNDNKGKKYISVTTLISKSFPEFDKEEIAKKIAIKRHTTKQALIKEWDQKSKEATRLGTRLHQNMEHYIKSEFNLMHQPQNLLQKIKFDAGKRVIEDIITTYKPISLQPQKVIFSPDFGIAGCVDLLVKIGKYEYIIFDWKCLSRDIQKNSYNNKTGNIIPTYNILDCNFYHYALQTSIYQNILKSENYIESKSKVQRILNVWNGTKFKYEPTPYLPESWGVMLWKNKINTN